MQAIKNNPYRTVGLLVGASAREQERQVRRLKQFIEAEQDPQDDFSFPFIGKLNRTIDTITDAASKLNLDSDKMNAALFWFWNGNPITDEAAFDALKDGNTETAYQIWDKLVARIEEDKRYWNEVSAKNLSAFHNRSVLAMITNQGSFVSAVMANIKFIESDYFDKFVKDAVDETYRVAKKDIQLNFLKTIFESIDNRKLSELVKYLNDYNFSAKDDFQKIFVQKPIEQIEQKIETAKSKRRSSKADAAKVGKELFASTANDLTKLKSITGTNDIKYTSIADKLANEILQCSIDYFNDSQEKDSDADYAKTAMQLAKQAELLAVGNLAKDRVRDSIDTLTEMADRELSQAIAVLQSIKDAYEEGCRQIDKQVDDLQYETFGRLGESQPMKVRKFNVLINWSKVEEMKRNCLAWNKVTEVIREAIPLKNIDKIKLTNNTTKLNEYKDLVNFLMSKISNSYKNSLAYICYWEVPKTTSSTKSPTNTYTPSTNSGSSSSQGDFEFAPNAWWILGIVGLIIGVIADGGGGAFIGALIGAGIGSKFND